MQICAIDNLAGFEQLRPGWDRVFDRDRHASVFLSWPWMRGWLEVSPYPWTVLAARQHSFAPWVAFLPISIRGVSHPYRFDQAREVHMAGDPGADYTGLVCDPDHEPAAIAALAQFVANQIEWDRIRFKEVNDPRIDRLLKHLPRSSTALSDSPGTCCPYIPLPRTWDEYLSQRLTPETRKSLKRRLKAVERDCRVRIITGASSADSIDLLIDLAARRRPDTVGTHLPRARSILRHCARSGLASIVTLWHRGEPIAAQGSFIDAKRCSLGVYLSGFDERYSSLSPGRVLDAVCIRDAIEQGMTELDFLRGNESYKFQFGAESRYTRNITVVRRGIHSATRLAMHQVRQSLHI